MIQKPQNLKPERIQDRQLPVTPERLRDRNGESANWRVDPTPNAIYRHFPQSSFQDSAAFLLKVGGAADKHGRELFAYVDATGVTVRLGNAPQSGVTEADLDLAAAIAAIA